MQATHSYDTVIINITGIARFLLGSIISMVDLYGFNTWDYVSSQFSARQSMLLQNNTNLQDYKFLALRFSEPESEQVKLFVDTINRTEHGLLYTSNKLAYVCPVDWEHFNDLSKNNTNDFSNFFDFLKDGELYLFIPKSGMIVKPPSGISADPLSGSFIAGDKYREQYKDTCYITTCKQ